MARGGRAQLAAAPPPGPVSTQPEPSAGALHARGWRGHLQLQYTQQGDRCVAHDRHEGPLRVLQPLYPEGESICHHVLVHPPGGVVGGDRLDIEVALREGTHALITAPGATRFYRSAGPRAEQRVHLQLARGARLEWLPLENIAYSGCQALNLTHLDVADEAQALGWDVLALGLPAADAPFDAGCFEQHLQWPGIWLERGRMQAQDRPLLDSPLGWAGNRVLGTIWFCSGQAWPCELTQILLEQARSALDAFAPSVHAGATSPHERVVLARVLAQRVEPAFAALKAVRKAWRHRAWGLAEHPPRIWGT